MTAIRIKCPTCGEMDLAPDDMSLFLTPSGDRGSYAFTCPECSQHVDRPASRKIVALLVAAGVEPTPISEDVGPLLPPEDRSPDPDAEAFTLDDLIEFHFLLRDDLALAAVLQG